MIKLLNIKEFNPKKSDIFIIDTNIWIFLFYPMGNHKQDLIEAYSSFYGKLLKSNCKILVPALVISEFFNTCSRLEHSRAKDQIPGKYEHYKKDFRNSKLYLETVEKLTFIIENSILRKGEKISDNFLNIHLENILNKNSDFDFNDCYLIELAREYNAKILSHDRDFRNYSVDFHLEIASKL